MTDTLEIDGVYLEYDLTKILTSVYLKCEAGKIVGLLGRNGSGKSSLLKIAFGSLNPQSKSVRVNECCLPHAFSTISYLPQNELIPSFITIDKALKLFKIDKQVIIDVFPAVKNVIGLKPSQLSGGLLRIIEVMLILNTPSKFCLLDEPFSGVMPVHVETLKDYMLIKKKSKGIILTDHLYRHVLSLSDNLYMLANGKTYVVTVEEELISRGYIRG